MATSPDSLLRRVKQFKDDAAPPPRFVGIDDWAWRRGRRYGTIVVDLERGDVIDLLPDPGFYPPISRPAPARRLTHRRQNLAKASIRGSLSQERHDIYYDLDILIVRRFVHDQVDADRYSIENEVITDALEQLRKQAQPIANAHGLIGALRDDAELLVQAVEHAMTVREERPWRLTTGE